MAALHVRVVAPDRVVYEGEASSVVVQAWDGQVGFLPGHAPLITLLGVGPCNIDHVGGGSTFFHIAGGTVKIEADHVTILTEYAGDEPPEAHELPDDVHVEHDLLENTSAGNIFA